mgnify:CR=1 FL=1
MNPLTTELELDKQQRQDDRLRKAGEMPMDEYARRLEARKFERLAIRGWFVAVFITINKEGPATW